MREISEETLKKARSWCASQFRQRRVLGEHPSHLAATILQEAEQKFETGTHGVEGFADDVGNEGIQYLNAGDSYALTLVVHSDRRNVSFHVGCWADFCEDFQ